MSLCSPNVITMVLVVAVSFLIARSYIRPYNERLSIHREILSDTVDNEYDYIIVGGGTGGSVVAGRLAVDKSNKVLLLEAGGFYDENPALHSVVEWFLVRFTELEWPYFTTPQTHSNFGMKEHRSYMPRGRVLGGSGMINVLLYARGNRLDYDGWESMGCTGWGYRDVLPYFLKSEDMHIERLQSSKYHNVGGPIAVSESDPSLFHHQLIQAAKELGYNVTDYNGEIQQGFSPANSLIRDGFRESTSLAYLGRRGKQDNLDIVIKSFVTKVQIEDNKATGVYYIRNGKKYFVRARKEIILSAGAINTPQLLMLSGIGPKDHLKDMKIPVVADLPVGDNLHDHVFVVLNTNINQTVAMSHDKQFGIWSRLQRELFGTGPLVNHLTEVIAFLSLDNSTDPGRIQFILNNVPFLPDNVKDSVADEITSSFGKDSVSNIVAINRPKSRGILRLHTNDPFDHPLIDPRYLTHDEDILNLTKGIRIWENYMQTPTMKSLGVDINQMKFSFCSKYEFRSDAYWECFVRHQSASFYHVCGTCKMGSVDDPSAVLDPELRVKGVTGLRVADASAFPQITSGNTNAPVIMLAEKAADMIRGLK